MNLNCLKEIKTAWACWSYLLFKRLKQENFLKDFEFEISLGNITKPSFFSLSLLKTNQINLYLFDRRKERGGRKTGLNNCQLKRQAVFSPQ